LTSREWDRDGDEQLPQRVEDEVKELLGGVLGFLNDEIKRIVGHGDITVLANIAISMQKYPGDVDPFLAVGSFPDDERIARAFVTRLHNILEGRGFGS
jgi:hypothetical protein